MVLTGTTLEVKLCQFARAVSERNRKWTFLIFGQCMRSNFQVNRLYTSNET